MFDYRECDFGTVELALCEYAIDLTLRPHEMTQENVNRLYDVGLNDEQITIAVQVISYFNYINRIADGLDVELEDWMTLSMEKWLKEKPKWR